MPSRAFILLASWAIAAVSANAACHSDAGNDLANETK
jgi:hypothetical protein